MVFWPFLFGNPWALSCNYTNIVIQTPVWGVRNTKYLQISRFGCKCQSLINITKCNINGIKVCSVENKGLNPRVRVVPTSSLTELVMMLLNLSVPQSLICPKGNNNRIENTKCLEQFITQKRVGIMLLLCRISQPESLP